MINFYRSVFTLIANNSSERTQNEITSIDQLVLEDHLNALVYVVL